MRRCHCQDDGREIPDRIICQPGIEARIDHEARRHDEQGMAIRRRFGGRCSADVASTGRQILHVERLAKGLRQRLRDHVRQHGGRAAGGKRHDDPHGPRRIGLRSRDRGNRQRRGSADEAQEAPTKRLHGVALRARAVGVRVRSSGTQKSFLTVPARPTAQRRPLHPETAARPA